LADGTYTYFASAKDASGNANSTDLRSITIGTAPEALITTFTYPTPANATVTGNTSFIANISIISSSLNELKWGWNGTNYTLYNDSALLMYNFENLSSLGENATKVVDISKYSNNGIVTGALWNASGRYGGAYQFDGAGDYITIENENAFDFERTSNFSLCMWVYTRQLANSTAGRTLVSKLGSNAIGWEFTNWGEGGNTSALTLYLINSWPNNVLEAQANGSLSLNQWKYVCSSYDGSSSTSGVRIYVNGVSKTI
jgi:hypothetical protein